jgi:putative methyltransferase (TIGR04325 family)
LEFTDEGSAAEGCAVYLSNGALQYIEPDLSEILGKLSTKPRHVLINRIPIYDGEPYFTVQNGYRAYVPYKVMNTSRLTEGMNGLGYRLIDEWELPRSLILPFHPDRFVPNYKGFYFTRS